jgi:hypothetical protein
MVNDIAAEGIYGIVGWGALLVVFLLAILWAAAGDWDTFVKWVIGIILEPLALFLLLGVIGLAWFGIQQLHMF